MRINPGQQCHFRRQGPAALGVLTTLLGIAWHVTHSRTHASMPNLIPNFRCVRQEGYLISCPQKKRPHASVWPFRNRNCKPVRAIAASFEEKRGQAVAVRKLTTR